MSLILQQRVSLKSCNSFGVEARAAWFARVQSVTDLQQLHADPRVRDLPRLVLGAGTNVLFAGDFDGLVIQAALPGVQELEPSADSFLVRVGAGQSWPALVEQLVRAGRPGLENLALIPGWAGAAPIQNIGAYGLELAERLHSVSVWEAASGACRELACEECGLGYRDSVFKRDRPGERIVVAITLRLPQRWQPITKYAELERELAARGCGQPEASDIFEAVCALRRRKLPDPARLGNAGSFFKNPVIGRSQYAELIERFPSMVSYPLAGGRFKIGAAWLIEACQLRGVTRGRVGTYEGQALVLVNKNAASGREVLDLAREVQQRVQSKFGVSLEPEVLIVGA
ncbi:UDP-N-acetylenolpyruvoylglucosamine reductase [Burkholderiales bacterium]|nr:UDP-N-acetylenolpyruvoylglucosamine reductase [Burkholderiales bacterium]